MNFYIYDLETMKNCFLFSGKFEDSNEIQTFELSSRQHELNQLINWLTYLKNANSTMVGYNSIQFDYPILHNCIQNPYTFSFDQAYMLAQQIIHSGERNMNTIRVSDRFIPQVDLVKVNHFDNPMKRTRLKDLQFAMRSQTVEDLPFDFSTDLTSDQMDFMRKYNVHDIVKTEDFLKKCKHLIAMRQELINNVVLS